MTNPFKINIQPNVIDDLKKRLSATRWPIEIANSNWESGTNETYLKELCAYWQNDFEWEKQQDYLNSFAQFKTSIDDICIHFIHVKGDGKNSIPLLLTHGYPDSFIRFLKLIPLLTKTDQRGLSFDLIIPSIPGYGFSDIPQNHGMNTKKIADLFSKLMSEELGYRKFIAHGGDWGSSITEQIALNNPDLLMGIHLTDIPFHYLLAMRPEALTDAERKYLEAGKQWQQKEGAYAMIQSTKPQSLAYGLNDSPAGLAGWITEKFYAWSDCNGNLENCFSKDELLTNITIYWATQTINSAINIYYETMLAMAKPPQKEINNVSVPTAAAIFPKDLVPAPKEIGEQFFPVRQWTEMPKGGHFAAMEQPQLLADDIRKFATLLM